MFKKKLLEEWLRGPPAAPHIFVVGGTGSGKTSLVRNIALHLLQHFPLNVVDFDGEYLTLPLKRITPKFQLSLPDASFLGWLLTQGARPEDGGYASSVFFDFNEGDLDEVFSKVKHDFTLPNHIRYALLWRLLVFKKYFTVKDESQVKEDESQNIVFDLSSILSIRERVIVQQILVSYLIQQSGSQYIIVEEAQPGPWISDISMLARRRGKKIIFVGQKFPEDFQNYEVILFTPYPIDTRRLPLPINPLYDKGVWWVGRLGIHRLKHLW